MRLVPLIVSSVLTILVIVLLSMQWGSVPPLGSFLSPQHGFWLNAEPVDKNYSEDLRFPQLEGKAEVYFDERMVPHVFAEKEPDAYFVQGYLHAKFRLWQMEFQTHAAAGRLSEILGVGPDSAILNNDRTMRRLGMVYGAKNSLSAMEADPMVNEQLNAYSAGVNAYIDQLSTKDLPIEYRLLNYTPEKWTNLKSALLLKYLSYDLTGGENDIEYTNARKVFNSYTFDKLYPVTQDSLDPIVSRGTIFDTASVKPMIPSNADSLYFPSNDSIAIKQDKPDPDNGSNNWAVNGSKTASGRPILCNDPHLNVSLPSIWYEIQVTTPVSSFYGASMPGAPSVIIGFNDSIAWGLTNAGRDVKDYYQVSFKGDDHSQYLFNGEYRKADIKVEEYRIKGGNIFRDTVAYTVFGPVMYDRNFDGGRKSSVTNLAVKWKAHDASNELKTFCLLSRAKNYDDYLEAIKNFDCPAQNFAFASKSNEIAIWQMGSFPAKWKRQGDFIMPGTDSTYLWQGDIPKDENPHMVNPERGFVSSANQMAVDSTYPYYIGGSHDLYRSLVINKKLASMQNITPLDMLALQNDNTNIMAEMILPKMLKSIDSSSIKDADWKYLAMLQEWNFKNDPGEKGATLFTLWFDSLHRLIYQDELSRVRGVVKWPEDYTLVEGLLRDSSYQFVDDINTSQKEDMHMMVTKAFEKVIPAIRSLDEQGRLVWSKYKDSGVRHLLRLEPFSRFHLTTGGGANIINATKQFHAPSWKMIVQLTDETEAYGIYPGGQSGNPGSRYYDNFVDDWAAGKNYRLWIMKKGEKSSPKIIARISFSKA